MQYVRRKMPFFYRLLLGTPLILVVAQTAICWIAAHSNDSIAAQFSAGNDDLDGQLGLGLALIFGGIAQGVQGVVIGGVSLLIYHSRFGFRRFVLVCFGLLCALLFTFFLSRNWNFEINHCGPDGCDATSAFSFDFFPVVYCALPVIWSLSLILGALVTPDEAWEFNSFDGIYVVEK